MNKDNNCISEYLLNEQKGLSDAILLREAVVLSILDDCANWVGLRRFLDIYKLPSQAQDILRGMFSEACPLSVADQVARYEETITESVASGGFADLQEREPELARSFINHVNWKIWHSVLLTSLIEGSISRAEYDDNLDGEVFDENYPWTYYYLDIDYNVILEDYRK